VRSESALRRAVSRQRPVNTPREGVTTPLGRYFLGLEARPNRRPITVALVDDYDVVVMGVATMFDKYRDE
jgi:hypothetical protein